MGFNSAFKGLISKTYHLYAYDYIFNLSLIYLLVPSSDLHEEIRQITSDSIDQYRLLSFTVDGNQGNASNQI